MQITRKKLSKKKVVHQHRHHHQRNVPLRSIFCLNWITPLWMRGMHERKFLDANLKAIMICKLSKQRVYHASNAVFLIGNDALECIEKKTREWNFFKHALERSFSLNTFRFLWLWSGCSCLCNVKKKYKFLIWIEFKTAPQGASWRCRKKVFNIASGMFLKMTMFSNIMFKWKRRQKKYQQNEKICKWKKYGSCQKKNERSGINFWQHFFWLSRRRFNVMTEVERKRAKENGVIYVNYKFSIFSIPRFFISDGENNKFSAEKRRAICVSSRRAVMLFNGEEWYTITLIKHLMWQLMK